MEKSFLEKVGEKILQVNTASGWTPVTLADWPEMEMETHDYRRYKIPAYLTLLHTEIDEAMQEFRKRDFKKFEEEMADIFIRLVGMCRSMNVQLEQRVCEKIKFNSTRPHRHGGKVI